MIETSSFVFISHSISIYMSSVVPLKSEDGEVKVWGIVTYYAKINVLCRKKKLVTGKQGTKRT